MKKKVLFIACMLAFAGVVSSCDDTSSQTNTTEVQQKYTYVFYDSDGITELKKESINVGEKIIAPSNPFKQADAEFMYFFDGWYTSKEGGEKVIDFSKITSNISFYARYNTETNKYAYTFYAEDGITILDSSVADYGTKLTPPTLTKSGNIQYSYVFDGWYTSKEGGEKITDLTLRTTSVFYPRFREVINQYTYTFYDEDGNTILKTDSIDYGTNIVAPSNPTKEKTPEYSYTFDGWYTLKEGGEKITDFEKITGDVSYYARYNQEVNQYTYKFVSDGKEVKNETIDYGDTIVCPNDPIKPADMEFVYIFDGWYTSEEDGEKVTTFGEIEENITYYARYIKKAVAYDENIYASGFVKGKMPNFDVYKNTSAYVKVSTADEFISALEKARNDYTSEYELIYNENLTTEQINKLNSLKNARKALIDSSTEDKPTTTLTALSLDEYTEEQLVKDLNELNYNRNNNVKVKDILVSKTENTFRVSLEAYLNQYVDVRLKQTLNKEATVHVIEIMNDLDLGFNNISSSSIVENWKANKTGYSVSSMLEKNGISKIKVSHTNNLLIYSKNGAKITHAGFSVESSDRVVFRNLEMDEIWQWEDSPSATPNFTVGDMDVFGWAYFKIAFCGYVWIDHCTFGKSYDGQIDVSNPYFYSYGTAVRAPYGKPEIYTESEAGGVHISNCKFLSGSDDKDGYLYKMMEEIEADYQKSLSDSTYQCQYLYYKTLRTRYNLTFEEILYGIAIPQKKAFLLGDSSESKKAATYKYNLTLKVSLANNLIVDIEDRLPNVRGGVAYMYNCIVDNSRYFKYRQILSNKGVGEINSYNSKYKLGLVSQGIIGGYGASINVDNCKFIGVNTLVKNNNTEKDDITSEQMVASYRMLNTIWYNDAESSDVDRIINTDTNPTQISVTGAITTTDFNWHNENDTEPFSITRYDLNSLLDSLNDNNFIGSNNYFDDLYLLSKENED